MGNTRLFYTFTITDYKSDYESVKYSVQFIVKYIVEEAGRIVFLKIISQQIGRLCIVRFTVQCTVQCTVQVKL